MDEYYSSGYIRHRWLPKISNPTAESTHHNEPVERVLHKCNKCGEVCLPWRSGICVPCVSIESRKRRAARGEV